MIDRNSARAYSDNVEIRLTTLLALVLACGSQGTDLKQLDNTVNEAGTDDANNPPPTSFTDPFAGQPAYTSKGGGGGGSHHAGESCMQSNCHSAGGGGGEAPAFLIGGTVYTDYFSTTPAVGVEVRIVDTNNNGASTYSDSNGNFYIHSSTTIGYPAVVGARNATITRPMITQISTAAMGSCGQGGCHIPGGKPTASYYQIHVP